MKPSFRIAVVLLAAVALVGCRRTNIPAAPPDNAPAAFVPGSSAQPGPFLFIAALDFSDEGCHTTSLVDMRKETAPFRLFGGGVVFEGGGGEDESGKWVEEPSSHRGADIECEARSVDGAIWQATATYDPSGWHEHKARTTFRVEPSSTAVLLLPNDEKPEYACVFCVLPEVEGSNSRANTSSAPVSAAKSAGPHLLISGVDLWKPREILATDVRDLSSPDGRQLNRIMISGRRISWDGYDEEGKPVGGSDRYEEPSLGWGYALSDGEVLSVHADMEFEGKKHKIEREMNVEKGSTQVLLLPEEKPRYAFVFCILPDVEKNQSEVKP